MTTYYVSPTGNNANAGTNAQPFATISKASSVLRPGDEVIIYAGNYRETIRPTFSGTTNQKITYRVAGDGPVVVTGAGQNSWGTDLSYKEHIVIDGIQFKGATLWMDRGNYNVIRNCKFDNLNPTYSKSADPWGTGVAILNTSTGNLIENCTIENTKGNGIFLSAGTSYNIVRNCIITNTNTEGSYGAAAVDMRGENNKVEYNTITKTGVHAIWARGRTDTIRYNDISDSGSLDPISDGGVIYTIGQDGAGTEISYNRINGGYNQPFNYQNPALRKQLGGIMLDDGSRNFIVHHNVVWNSQVGIKIGANRHNSGHRIYNNTLWGNIMGAFGTYGSAGVSDIRIYNNLTDNNAGGWVGTDVRNNLITTNPGFVDAANNNFQLQGSSIAIDRGLVISGFTDGYTGAAPDVGAYEFGRSWSAGTNLSTPAPAPAPVGTGTGLFGEYFNNIDFSASRLTRTDSTVNFNWGGGSPASPVGSDTFSVRWTGQVQPRYSETYTFYTTADDGIRLWVDGKQIINNFVDQAPTERSGSITLEAGKKYDIRVEYYENGGAAVAQLAWSSPSQAKQIIPQSQLYSPASAPAAPSSYRIEGENIDLITGFRVENIAAASGGKAISLVSSGATQGTASFNFNGVQGSYNVFISSFDENDGEARIDLTRNSSVIGSITLNQQLPDSLPSARNQVTRQIATNRTFNPGDQIHIRGYKDASELARIDFIEFVPVAVI